jgi:ribosomal protein S18 acetylase RimI-like enzyme
MSHVRLGLCRRRELTPAHLEEIAAYAAGCNRDPAQHIGYVGQTPEEVTGELGELDGDAVVAVARDGGRLCGLLAAEWDVDLGRTWLHGPWADSPDLMDRLYRAVLPHLPAAAGTHELFIDTANTAVAGFAARHGFAPHGHQVILRFARDRLAGLPAVTLPRLTPRWHEQFAALHDRAFPGTYAPAAKLLADAPPILVATDGDTLLGYVALKLRPGDAQVEYLAVAESARRQGVGTRLLVAALHEALRDPGYEAVDLVTDNPSARQLYERVGFTLLHEMRSFRRPLADGPGGGDRGHAGREAHAVDERHPADEATTMTGPTSAAGGSPPTRHTPPGSSPSTGSSPPTNAG